MRYVFTLLLAVLFALPAFAQMEMGVDNCCQMGRACETDAEWVQGYYDYRGDMCASDMMSDDMGDMDMMDDMGDTGMMDDMGDTGMMDDMGDTGMMDDMGDMGMMMPPTNFTFIGNGKTTTTVFTLSPGKWEVDSDLGQHAEHAIRQVDSMGNYTMEHKCLAWPYWHNTMGANDGSAYQVGFYTPTKEDMGMMGGMGMMGMMPKMDIMYDYDKMDSMGMMDDKMGMMDKMRQGPVFIARYPCDVVLDVYVKQDELSAGQESWKFFIQKIDGNA